MLAFPACIQHAAELGKEACWQEARQKPQASSELERVIRKQVGGVITSAGEVVKHRFCFFLPAAAARRGADQED